MIVLLLAVTPSNAGPYIGVDSRGLDSNKRIYSLIAGNDHLEITYGVDTTGDVSSSLITRIRF